MDALLKGKTVYKLFFFFFYVCLLIILGAQQKGTLRPNSADRPLGAPLPLALLKSPFGYV